MAHSDPKIQAQIDAMLGVTPEERAGLVPVKPWTLHPKPTLAVTRGDIRRQDASWRRRVCAAVWLLGASWGNLGKLFGIDRANMSKDGNKELPLLSEQSGKLSWEQMEVYVVACRENRSILDGMKAPDIAIWLRENVSLSNL